MLALLPSRLLAASDAGTLGDELRTQTLRRIEEVLYLDQVILAVEERPQLFQLDLVADAQLRFRLGDAPACDEAARAELKERFRLGLRFLAVERDCVRERLFARADL